jgi:hypothetical protein
MEILPKKQAILTKEEQRKDVKATRITKGQKNMFQAQIKMVMPIRHGLCLAACCEYMF